MLTISSDIQVWNRSTKPQRTMCWWCLFTLWRCSKCCTCHAKRAWGAPSSAPAMQNEPEVLQALHLPRKTSRGCSKRARSNQLSPNFREPLLKVLQVLHLPHKTGLRCSKCCTCHATWAGGAPSAAPATQNEAAPKVINCRRTFADLYEGAKPEVLQVPEMLQVLHLPHKNEATPKVINCCRTSGRPVWRCSSECCHAKRACGAPSAAPATQNGQVLHCHAKRAGWRCSKCCHAKRAWGAPCKCCTCHAKRAGCAPSAAPAKVINCCQTSETSVDLYEGAPSAASATQDEPEVLQVLHLPRKPSLRCSKCCSCHAKRAGGAPNLPRKNPAAPKVFNCRRAFADFYRKVLQVLRLPRKNEPEVLQAPPKSNRLSPDFRGPLGRCSKGRTCHAKRAGGAPSAAPATQNEPEVLQVPRKNEAAPKVFNCRCGLYDSKRCTCHAKQVLQVLRLPRKTKRHPK